MSPQSPLNAWRPIDTTDAELLSNVEAALLAAILASPPPRKTRALALAAGLPLATAHDAIGRLERRGLIAREAGRQGTLRPLVRAEAP